MSVYDSPEFAAFPVGINLDQVPNLAVGNNSGDSVVFLFCFFSSVFVNSQKFIVVCQWVLIQWEDLDL